MKKLIFLLFVYTFIFSFAAGRAYAGEDKRFNLPNVTSAQNISTGFRCVEGYVFLYTVTGHGAVSVVQVFDSETKEARQGIHGVSVTNSLVPLRCKN